MKTSIETINGKLCTIVWHGYNPIKNTIGRRFATLHGGTFAVFKDADCLDHIATAIPALPRNPKPKDAPLLYRYASEGLMVWWTDNDEEKPRTCAWVINMHLVNYNQLVEHTNLTRRMEITHAVDSEGNKVEVAINNNNKGEYND